MDSKKRKKTTAKTSGGKKSGKAVKTDKQSQLSADIAGVIWIMVSLLMFLALYVTEKSGLGKYVSMFTFGVLGIAGFAVPFVCMFIGVMCFIKRKVRIKPALYIALGLFTYVLLVFLDILSLPGVTVTFGKYIGNAYIQSGIHHWYGGFMGALLSYPLISLCTRAGAYIVDVTLFIILCIVFFRVSISDAIMDIHERNQEKRNQRRLMREQEEEDDDDDYYYGDEDYTSTAKTRKGKRNKSDDYDDEPDLGDDDDSDDTVPDDEDYSYSVDVPVHIYSDEVYTDENPQNTDNDDEYFEPEDEDYKNDNRLITQYMRPSYSLLDTNPQSGVSAVAAEEAERQGRTLVSALASFGVQITISHISIGPTVTRFEVQLAKGTRIDSVLRLNKDIALALAVGAVRFEAPIPGKQAIGIEVPNKQTSLVCLRDILETREFTESASPLTIAVGKDIVGKTILADIAKMPHLLIAGATGTGKSVCLNAIIMSLVYKSSPEDVRLILIDPKIVEFSMYSELPHLYIPVVTDHKKAAASLKWSVSEMERRYRAFSNARAKDITAYNSLQHEPDMRMPRIVIIIDELAELMMAAAKEVEDYIMRIAQLGRACGIHLIVATQRPSVDIITGKIKANIVSRIAFQVTDATNSKVILDTTGAECLVGRGDMLMHTAGATKPARIQCAFVSTEEVEEVIGFFREHNVVPEFDEMADSQIEAGVTVSQEDDQDSGESDELLISAGRTVVETKRASTSLIQQRFRIGYNRASRIMNELERKGVVSAPDPIKKDRKVLMDINEFEKTFRLGMYATMPQTNGTQN